MIPGSGQGLQFASVHLSEDRAACLHESQNTDDSRISAQEVAQHHLIVKQEAHKADSTASVYLLPSKKHTGCN